MFNGANIRFSTSDFVGNSTRNNGSAHFKFDLTSAIFVMCFSQRFRRGRTVVRRAHVLKGNSQYDSPGMWKMSKGQIRMFKQTKC